MQMFISINEPLITYELSQKYMDNYNINFLPYTWVYSWNFTILLKYTSIKLKYIVYFSRYKEFISME